MGKEVNVGIVGLGIYIPDKVMTAAQISEATLGVWSEQAVIEKLGIVQKTMPGDDDGTQEMGAKAALDCLSKTGVDPSEIDVILCFGEEWKEYPLTTSALYIQDRIKAVNAWGVDVQNRCCTSVTALKMAKDMLIADDDIQMILVCGGYRNGDFVDFTDKNMSMMYNLGAGGAAILLKKNYNKNLLLGSHIIADGSLARTAGVEIGGTCRPITKDNVDEAYKSLRLMQPEVMKNRLNEVSQQNWLTCIDRAFEKSNISKKELGYLAILHIKRSGHLGMLKDLGLSEDRSIYLENYGHIGQVDQLLSLALALEKGKVVNGTVVCMLAAGIGYVWAANVIRWGEVA
ncbi:MAG: 3-oxoacyl-ACP synthase [Erysipelothrix sp.]|nr:3-oxoacyl-ACP synthase [Erysipelothrix sp.]